MTSKLTAFLVAILLTASLRAEDWTARLADAPSIDVIAEYYYKFKQFGTPYRRQVTINGERYFAFWIVGPKRTTEFFWLYHLANQNWHLVADHPAGSAHLESKVVWNNDSNQFQMISPSGEVQASYPSYPTYPNYPRHPSYPKYPRYPSYPTYPGYPAYPGSSTYPKYPGYPKHPDYPSYPSYASTGG